MKTIVLNSCNLNAVNENQWNSFCEYISPFVEAHATSPIESAIVSVSKDGESVTIKFDIGERESLQTITAKFNKFMCKEWMYHNFDKKFKNIPPYNITLTWQVFLNKVFGETYKSELDDFYKKNDISTTLIRTLIKNSSNQFKF